MCPTHPTKVHHILVWDLEGANRKNAQVTTPVFAQAGTAQPITTPPNSASKHGGSFNSGGGSQLLFTFPDIVNPSANTRHSTGSPSGATSNGGSANNSFSSVLHVQDNCLSSDDFHEAMFIGKPSPSPRKSAALGTSSSGKRRKRSRGNVKLDRESSGNNNITGKIDCSGNK